MGGNLYTLKKYAAWTLLTALDLCSEKGLSMLAGSEAYLEMVCKEKQDQR